MNVILPLSLLLISGVSSQSLQCPKSNGKFAIENTDCKSYYECENWKVTSEKICPEGQTFNPSLQRCDYEELYYCAEKEIEKYKICKQSSGKFPKKDSNCKGYYTCEKWKVTGEFTCPPRENFNPEQQWCDWEELYPCLEDKPSSKCLKPNGNFPKLGSQCKSYYHCINSKPVELHCDGDLVFDPINQICEWPELYTCDEAGESTIVVTSRVTTRSPTTSSTEETSRSTATTTERTRSTAMPTTSSTTVTFPTTDVSESEETESTFGITFTTDRSSSQTERTDEYTLSTKGTTTDRTSGIDEDTTGTTEETLPPTTPQTTQTSTLSSEGSSFGTETSQIGGITSDPNTVQTRTVSDAFSTASIQTDDPDEVVCPRANGIFPHPTDETKFISCLEFKPTVMSCPHDLIYDPAVVACIYKT